MENNNIESNMKPEPNNSTNSNDSDILTNILAYNKDNLFTKIGNNFWYNSAFSASLSPWYQVIPLIGNEASLAIAASKLKEGS